uniref:Secreted protein n=1 Tax=Ditylenchus dipsaci TaxID=166011 RepID=A0A915E626_9BILA
MQSPANFLTQLALFTIFFVRQSLSQSLSSGFAGLTPPSGFPSLTPSSGFAQQVIALFSPPGYSDLAV